MIKADALHADASPMTTGPTRQGGAPASMHWFSAHEATLRALIFDFDGLICDTEGCLAMAARDVFEAHGATLPMDRWLDLIGRSSEKDVWIPWLEEAIGRRVDRNEVLAAFDQRNHALIDQLDASPGVREIIATADRTGITLAVASSSPTSWVEPLLDRLGLREHFAAVVCREHARRAKPAPDLYLEALRRVDVPARAAIAFEDSRNGSLAAIAAGIACVVVPNELTRMQDFSHATAIVPSLTTIDLALLEGLIVDPALRSPAV